MYFFEICYSTKRESLGKNRLLFDCVLLWKENIQRKNKSAKSTAIVLFQNLEHEVFGFFTFEYSCRSLYKTMYSRNGDNSLRLTFWDGRWKKNCSSGVILKHSSQISKFLLAKGFRLECCLYVSLYYYITVGATHGTSWYTNPPRAHRLQEDTPIPTAVETEARSK